MGGGRVKRQTWYDLVATIALAVGGVAGFLAAVGAALIQPLSAAAAAVCAIAFLIPGLYILGYARGLRARDVALAHTAAFATSRGAFEVQDLASELSVSKDDAEKILQTAVREGHLRGHFDHRGRFVSEPNQAAGPEGAGP
jgi:hypothetical protein